jgi:hypothetical protein
VEAAVASRDLDALLSSTLGNICYLTGFQTSAVLGRRSAQPSSVHMLRIPIDIRALGAACRLRDSAGVRWSVVCGGNHP